MHDPRLKDADNPCGLCLNEGNICAIRFVKMAKSGYQVDLRNSRCRNLYKISLKHAAKFSKTSPCTNVPLRCPLCPKISDTVWKYNLRSHISKIHGSATLALYEGLYKIRDDEATLLKAIYLAKPRRTKKKVTPSTLKISEAHSTRVSLRYVSLTIKL